MRSFMLFGWMALAPLQCIAVETNAEWKMPEAESQKWLSRVRAMVLERGWTVTAAGNEILITRDKPAAMNRHWPNAASAEEAAKGEPAGDLTLQLVLRFGPKLSTDEYERLAAVNAASERKHLELREALGLPYKFDSVLATTPAEKARLQKYRAAVAKLPRYELPDFYTPEHSIHYVHRWHLWMAPADKTVGAEWLQIEEQLIRCFGMYDPLAVANRTDTGEYLDEAPR